jgi:hypothetical protein
MTLEEVEPLLGRAADKQFISIDAVEADKERSHHVWYGQHLWVEVVFYKGKVVMVLSAERGPPGLIETLRDWVPWREWVPW